MIRRAKHAARWLGIGAALAYLFDPERGGARRDAVRTRAMHLIDSAKGSVAQLRADADDVVAHVAAPAPAGSVSPAPAKAAAV